MNTSEFASTTLPQHIAIIMDGNGRWASQRHLPRMAGHQQGLVAVRQIIKAAIQYPIAHLTLFAFSSENWQRPPTEVSFLLNLFATALEHEMQNLHAHHVRLLIVGNRQGFAADLLEKIQRAETLTQHNTGLVLNVAVNYGGRWDIVQAINRLQCELPEKAGHYTEEDLASCLMMSHAPPPDLFIRTGGEQRISNFLLWQIAYTELYFSDTLWPDFDEQCFAQAIRAYQQRERRFGRVLENS